MNEPVIDPSEPSPGASEPERTPASESTLKTSEAPKNGGSPGLRETLSWERATLEKLVFASLQEQRLARRWRTFVRLAWLLFFVTLGWFVFSEGVNTQNVPPPHTAVIEIMG
jgi:protease-4